MKKKDSLISECSKIHSLKLEIKSLKKHDYPYLRASLRNWTDSTASYHNSKNRKAEDNEWKCACRQKKSQDKKPKVFKTGTNINHQRADSAIRRPPKRRHLYIGRLSNSDSTDDIREYCENKGADLLCICEISRETSRLKSLLRIQIR